MSGNSFGKEFRITSFGESHGPAIGVVIDGCPAGLEINPDFINRELKRRRPGQSSVTTQRKEADTVEILSGVFEGKSTGAPITLLIRSKNQKSSDYDHLENTFRPSHADYTYFIKYGHRDHRGGGRASARETAARVAAGAVAKLWLSKKNVKVQAYVSQVGKVKLEKPYNKLDLDQTDANPVHCPDAETAAHMEEHIKLIRKEGDTIGGIVSCVIRNCPPGLGEPVYDKLHAELGKAMLSINAVKGFEIGSGFSGVAMKGSEHNDIFEPGRLENIKTRTNNSGGVQGGISNGMDIHFKVAFKPVATIMQDQESINTKGEKVKVKGKGRHDPCVVPRAVPIVEAMAAVVIMDFWLRKR